MCHTVLLTWRQVYPTDVRAFFHGISAAAGKLGAIVASTVFTHVGCGGSPIILLVDGCVLPSHCFRQSDTMKRFASQHCKPARTLVLPCGIPHRSFPYVKVQVDTVTTFYASAGAGVAGALLTWLFLPDTTGLDLAETDHLHRYMLAGQVGAAGWCRVPATPLHQLAGWGWRRPVLHLGSLGPANRRSAPACPPPVEV
jgi:hypothetical protein